MSSSTSSEWPITRVRQSFVDFFVDKGCKFIKSSSSIPFNDPTLLFTNAGMNQFKTKFLGTTEQAHPFYSLKGAANSQKCIRAGGKHNDLDDVGRDTYHHTFFEMMGNWSFGDYFKKEAIAWAWELLTKVFKLDPERLYASYYEGDKELGLEPDTESYELWQQYIPKERIVPGNTKDNFWEMGSVGPCGVSSEIHYDMIGGGRNAADKVNVSDEVIEIWNLVFIQYNRNEPNGPLEKLTENHVDTGMGLERVCAILQGVPSNYDIDVFQPIFKAIQKISNKAAYSGKFFDDDPKYVDMSYRVIADHMRTLTIAISDGQSLGSEGRAYVLRRILRRAMFYAREYLHIERVGFLSDLVPSVVESLKDAYPELETNQSDVQAQILTDEQKFADCLKNGNKKFQKILSKLKQDEKFPIDQAFFLYDSYGFPADLTIRMLEQVNRSPFTIDQFNDYLQEEKSKTSGADKFSNATSFNISAPTLSHLENSIKAVATNDSFKYNALEQSLDASVLAIFDGESFRTSTLELKSNEQSSVFAIFLDKTQFYAESGGQSGDFGQLKFELPSSNTDASSSSASSSSSSSSNQDKQKFIVTDTQKFGKYVAHIGRLDEGSTDLRVGANVTQSINQIRRQKLMCNHTATHILNWSLRNVFGDKITQKGSAVDETRFRFDFNHNKTLSVKQLEAIDKHTNSVIEKDLEVFDHVAPREMATKIQSLRFLPDELYPDEVRVVSIGKSVDDLLSDPESKGNYDFSIEFCGGTHMRRTSEAQKYATIGDEIVSSGIRRITGVTGKEAFVAEKNSIAAKQKVVDAAKWDSKQLQSQFAKLREEIANPETIMVASVRRDLLKQMDQLYSKMMSSVKSNRSNTKKVAQEFVKQTLEQLESSPKPFFVGHCNVEGNRKLLGFAQQQISKKLPELAIMLLTANKTAKKPVISFTSVVPKSVFDNKKFSASDWMKATTAHVGGKGGGRPTMANGSTMNVDKLEDALAFANQFASKAFSD